jgi:phosphoglycerate dehydrogenase-like enzyme
MAHRVVLWTPVARAEIEARIATVPGTDLVIVEDIDGLAAALPDSEVLVTMGQLYGAEMAKLLRRDGKRLRWIHLLTAGYDGLIFHGVPPGVTVTNAGDCYSPMVAEHAMMLLLALVRRLPLMLANQARHAFDRSFLPRLGALDGATMAIVGFGSIGREVARRARPFGMHILGLTRSARPDPLADEIHPITELHEMLGRADAVVLAMPLSAETRHLIGAAELAACRRNTVLINVARGGVVDPVALGAALRSGQIAGAGLDVTEPEPLPPGDPLWTCPNLIVSPHVAALGSAAVLNCLAELTTANLRRFIAGETLTHRITIR